jgi:hypothetical protein
MISRTQTSHRAKHAGQAVRRSSGQAMVEFLIAATTVLIPLFLIVPLLGKYMDMKSTSIQAARYAAWERTVWFGSTDWAAAEKTDAQIQNEVQWRFFSDTATVKFQAGDMNAAGWGGAKPLWHDRAGNAMLVTYNADVTQASARTDTPGLVNDILDPIVSAIGVVGDILGAKFVLDMQSLYTSTVTARVQPTRKIEQVLGGPLSDVETFKTVTPVFTEKNVLIANGWSANGAAQTKKQTEGLTPTSFLQRSPISDVLTVIQYLAYVFAPELAPDHLKLGGVIQPDIVPDDRLK